MPELLIGLPPPGELAAGTVAAEGESNLDETFLAGGDAEIVQILIEKPAASALTVTLDATLDTTSISVLLVSIAPEDSVTTALRASGVRLQRRGRGRLRVQTTGAVSGTKKVCVFLRPLP